MGWALFGDINLGVWAYGYVYYEVWTPPGFIWMWIFSDVTVGKKRARGCGPTWRGVHGLSNAHRATVYDA